MRIQIHADSVKTEPLRELLAALSRHNLPKAEVGCNGPECWTVTTPFLKPKEFAQLFGDLVTVDGDLSVTQALAGMAPHGFRKADRS